MIQESETIKEEIIVNDDYFDDNLNEFIGSVNLLATTVNKYLNDIYVHNENMEYVNNFFID